MSYWDWSLAPIKDAAGRVERLVMTLLNVTERKRAEDEAFERLGNRSFAAVLMDIQMPVIDGFQATAEIRKLEDSTLPRRRKTPMEAAIAIRTPLMAAKGWSRCLTPFPRYDDSGRRESRVASERLHGDHYESSIVMMCCRKPSSPLNRLESQTCLRAAEQD